MAVASMGKPIAILNLSIHGPGFGNFFSQAGTQQSATYGAASPIPIVIKISMILTGLFDRNAKPRAAPRMGAVQGVASIVARTPLKNAPEFPSREASVLAASKAFPLTVISKTPKRFMA